MLVFKNLPRLSCAIALAISTTEAAGRDPLPPAPPPPQSLSAEAKVQTCFTPGHDCEGLIITLIGSATQTINLQAYGFTSRPIAQALLSAHSRGVVVTLIIDKDARRDHETQAGMLAAAGITVMVDDLPAVAHNKTMIIDRQTLITGSYNWTNSAQKRNAENIIVIYDATVSDKYFDNFEKRRLQSSPWWQ